MCVSLFSLRDSFFPPVYNDVRERCSFMTTLSCATRLETRTKESHMCAMFWALHLQYLVGLPSAIRRSRYRPNSLSRRLPADDC